MFINDYDQDTQQERNYYEEFSSILLFLNTSLGLEQLAYINSQEDRYITEQQ